MRYSEYRIGSDGDGTFSVGNGFGKNVTIFEIDGSSSVHLDKKKKDILALDAGPTQGLDGAILTTEKSIKNKK